MARRWQVAPSLPDDILAQRHSIASSGRLDITPLLVQLLHNRGIEDPAEFEPFLAADERLTHPTRDLPDIDKAVTRILRCLLGDELIAVFGDFDADGITGTALLVDGIERLGGKAVHYIPHRHDEGHGLNMPALKGLKDQGASLVITVDCGIREHSEIEQGRAMGLDFIVTDHHETDATQPSALAAIDPKRPDSAYPFSELAGVGVAFKLLQALCEATQKGDAWEESLDLVALGTVTDMVPLRDENRHLVKRGLEVLNDSQRMGVVELVHSANLEMGMLDEQNIAFALGPRLNASGRMDHAVTSYELLMATSRPEARALAAKLDSNNRERQKLTSEVWASARAKLLQEGTDRPLLMTGEAVYPPGVVGVVAGKLSDEFYRPTVVLQLDGENARGSARSIPEFDILGALTQCQDLLTRFGGHRQAAGFLMPRANVDTLQRRLIEVAGSELAGIDLRPTVAIDCELPLSTLSGDMYRMISKMAPFGQGNRVPVFLSRNVTLLESRKVGANGTHLKLKLKEGKAIWDAIAFNLAERDLSSHLDIVYNLEQENWNGRQLLQLNVVDFLPSS